MQRFNAIRCATVLLTLGLTLFGGVKSLLACDHGGYGYGGFGYSYSAPVYRMPVYSAPAYSAPAYSAPAYSAPVYAAPVAAPAPALPNSVIELTNSEDDTVAYTLNGERFDMQPRYNQKLTTRPSWVIQFDRGGSFGTASYTLTQGKYKFVATDHGWDVNQDTGRPAAPTPVANYADNR